MQGSFWKTVALVAVIGVGSLAILEVQNRLQKSPSALEASAQTDDTALSEQLNAVNVTSIDAELSESEFDKMLKAEFPTPGQQTVGAKPATLAADFNLSEPESAAPQTFQANSDAAADQFSMDDLSEQTGTGASDWTTGDTVASAIDTNVDAGFLTETPNPFATLAAVDDSNSSNIKPVGFVSDDQSPDDSSSESPFAAFDPFENSAPAASDTTTPAMTDVANSASITDFQNNQTPASRQAGQMEFFNGANREASTETPPKTVSAAPIAFGQELDEDVFNDAVSDGGFSQFEPDEDASRSPAGGSNPFPGFDFEPEPSPRSTEPERLPTPDTMGNGQRSPFFPEQPAADSRPTEEMVPMPRTRFDAAPEFDSGSGLGAAGGFDETGRGLGAAGSGLGAAGSSFDDSLTGAESLPFAEDNRLDVPVLNPVPAPGQDDRLPIPGMGRERELEPRPGTFDGNGFDSQPTNPARIPDFNDFPATDRSPSELADPWGQDGNIQEMNPVDFDPIDRSDRNEPARRPDRSRDDLGSPLDFPDRRFDSERQDRPSNREIDPGFGSQPGRIPTLEDRRDDRRMPSNDNLRNSTPLSVDPGFGSDRQEFDSRGYDSRGSDRSQDYLSEPSSRTPAFGGTSNGGSGPIRREREFGGSSFDRRQEDLRGADQRRDGNVRQIASVMRPKLTLEKSAPENATVGTPLQYSITVRNDGDAPAYNVIVEDEIASSSRVNAAKPQASRSNDGGRLVWEFDSIGPGEEEEIQVQVTPEREGVLDGVATVKFKSRVKATTTITAPRLELKMEGPAKVRLGDKVHYRYVITNEGSGEARSVFVRTVLPQNGGLRHPQGQDLEYEIPLMEPGEQREILLSVVAGEPGNQRAQALVTSRNGSKDEATWSTDVVGAQLQMMRRGPKRRFVSKTARYENIVTNETDFDAVNARVIEEIPPGMEFKKAGQNGRYDRTRRTVTWEIRRLAAKATTTLQLELEPRVAGPQDSRVTIKENIGAQSDDYVSTTVVEDLHNVSATISQLDGPVAMGEVFGFTIAVDNRGTADATDVELSVEVPPEIEVFGAGTKEVPAGLKRGTNTVVYKTVVRIKPDQLQDFELKLRGIRPGRNKIVKASVRYTQMSEPLEISESVTIYDDQN
ncbi:MAG: hypothetical protein ABJZ55_02705 [Fuerstiella sp.]